MPSYNHLNGPLFQDGGGINPPSNTGSNYDITIGDHVGFIFQAGPGATTPTQFSSGFTVGAAGEIRGLGALSITTQASSDLTLTSANDTLIDTDTLTLKLGDASGAEKVLITDSGDNTKFSVSSLGDAVVARNLTVQGTMYTTHAEEVNIGDNYLYLNAGYVTDAAVTSGMAVNYDPTTTQDVCTGTGVFSNATSTVTVDASNLSANDIIQVSGTQFNDGIYEVSSDAAGTLTIKTSPVEDFSMNNFTDETNTSAVITKVNVAVIRAGTSGDWYVGKGSSTPIAYSVLATAAGATLQSAYEAGNTITTDGGNGNVAISGTEAFTVDMDKASSINVTGAGLTLSTTTSGSILVDGEDGVEINSASGNISIGNDAVTGAINIGTGASARPIAIGSSSSASLALEAGVGAFTALADTTMDLDAGGALSLNSSAGVINVGNDNIAQNINVGTAGARTITVGNASATEVQIDSVLVDINGGASGVTIDAGAASNFTTSSGNLTLYSASALLLTSVAAGSLTIPDNTATAFSIIASGDATYWEFQTTDGEEALQFNGSHIIWSVDGGGDIGSVDGGTTMLRPDNVWAKTLVKAGDGVVMHGVNHEIYTTDVAGSSSSALTLRTGSPTGGDYNSGALTLDSGTPAGAGTAGAVNVAPSNATAVAVGNSGGTATTTTVYGKGILDTSITSGTAFNVDVNAPPAAGQQLRAYGITTSAIDLDTDSDTLVAMAMDFSNVTASHAGATVVGTYYNLPTGQTGTVFASVTLAQIPHFYGTPGGSPSGITIGASATNNLEFNAVGSEVVEFNTETRHADNTYAYFGDNNEGQISWDDTAGFQIVNNISTAGPPLQIYTVDRSSGSAASNQVRIQSGSAGTGSTASSGVVQIRTGDALGASGNSGRLLLDVGYSRYGSTGDISIGANNSSPYGIPKQIHIGQYGMTADTTNESNWSLNKVNWSVPTQKAGVITWEDRPGTTIAAGSDGQSLPQATINVASAANFPASGTIDVATYDNGVQTVTYTGTTGTSFTGCSGGTGTLHTGGAVTSAGTTLMTLDTNTSSFPVKRLTFTDDFPAVFGSSGQGIVGYAPSLVANTFIVRSSNLDTDIAVVTQENNTPTANSDTGSISLTTGANAGAVTDAGTYYSGDIAIQTGAMTGAETSGSLISGSIALQTGNNTNGDSGGITLDVGTAGGNVGHISIGETNAEYTVFGTEIRVGTAKIIQGTEKIQIPANTDGTLALQVGHMTTGQRDALGSPANGMIIYNTTANVFQVYENGSWEDLATGGDVSLQTAYNNGDTIDITTGNPIEFNVPNLATGPALKIDNQNGAGGVGLLLTDDTTIQYGDTSYYSKYDGSNWMLQPTNAASSGANASGIDIDSQAGGDNAGGGGYTAGAIAITTGAGGSATSAAGIGAAGGTVTFTTGAGGDSIGDNDGAAGGAFAVVGGAGGDADASANAIDGGTGGGFSFTGGAGGTGAGSGFGIPDPANGAGGGFTVIGGLGGTGNANAPGGLGGAISITGGKGGAPGASFAGGYGGALTVSSGPGSTPVVSKGTSPSGDATLTTARGQDSTIAADAGDSGTTNVLTGDGGGADDDGNGGNAGYLNVQSGAGGYATSDGYFAGNGGDLYLYAGQGGDHQAAGASNTGGNGGALEVTAGQGGGGWTDSGDGGTGGDLTVTAGRGGQSNTQTGGDAGSLYLVGGRGGTGNTVAGGAGGSVEIVGGQGGSSSGGTVGDAGGVTIDAGNTSGAGAHGAIAIGTGASGGYPLAIHMGSSSMGSSENSAWNFGSSHIVDFTAERMSMNAHLRVLDGNAVAWGTTDDVSMAWDNSGGRWVWGSGSAGVPTAGIPKTRILKTTTMADEGLEIYCGDGTGSVVAPPTGQFKVNLQDIDSAYGNSSTTTPAALGFEFTMNASATINNTGSHPVAAFTASGVKDSGGSYSAGFYSGGFDNQFYAATAGIVASGKITKGFWNYFTGNASDEGTVRGFEFNTSSTEGTSRVIQGVYLNTQVSTGSEVKDAIYIDSANWTHGIYASSALEIDGAAAISIGSTSATGVNLSRAGVLTTVKDDLDIDGDTLTLGGAVIYDNGVSALVLGNGTDHAPQMASLTTAERDALTATNGMIIYNETTASIQGYEGGWVDLSTGSLTMDETYNNGHSITVDAGAIDLNVSTTSIEALDIDVAGPVDNTNAVIDIAFGAGAWTGQPTAIELDYSGMTSLSNGSDVVALNLKGKTNAGAGDSIGIEVDANFDIGMRLADSTKLVFGTTSYYAQFNGSNFQIQPSTATSSGANADGIDIDTQAGGDNAGGNGYAAGALALTTGAGGSATVSGDAANGGTLTVTTGAGGDGNLGAGSAAGDAGDFLFLGGTGGTNAGTGGLPPVSANGQGGEFDIRTGAGGAASTQSPGGAGGNFDFTGGTGGAGNATKAGGVGGGILFRCGQGGATGGAGAGAGGAITFAAGNSTGGTGGDVNIDSGTGSARATYGAINIGTGFSTANGPSTINLGDGSLDTGTASAWNFGASHIVAWTGTLEVQDNSKVTLGTDSDFTMLHDGTNTVFDNTFATGSTIMRLGTDTSATSFQVQNNSESGLFKVDGAGTVTVNNQATITSDSESLVLGDADHAPALASLTTAERDALAAANGMIIYNETTASFEGYEGGSWVDLSSSSLTMDETYNNGHTITVDAGPIQLNVPDAAGAVTALDINASDNDASGNIIFVDFSAEAWTGAPVGLYMDYSSMTSLSNAGDVHAIYLAGITNGGAGDSIGLEVDSGFDIGIRLADNTKLVFGTSSYETQYVTGAPDSLTTVATAQATGGDIGAAISWTAQQGSDGSSGAGSAGGAISMTCGVGGDGDTNQNGGAGGALTFASGTGGAGDGTGVGAAGGALTLIAGTGGAGGATDADGGAGGAVSIDSGPGGAPGGGGAAGSAGTISMGFTNAQSIYVGNSTAMTYLLSDTRVGQGQDLQFGNPSTTGVTLTHNNGASLVTATSTGSTVFQFADDKQITFGDGVDNGSLVYNSTFLGIILASGNDQVGSTGVTPQVAIVTGTAATYDSGQMQVNTGGVTGNDHVSGQTTISTGHATNGSGDLQRTGDLRLRTGDVKTSATGAGVTGALTISSGEAAVGTGNTGAVSITSGDSAGGTSGAITLDTGTGAVAPGAITVGGTNADYVYIHRSGGTLTLLASDTRIGQAKALQFGNPGTTGVTLTHDNGNSLITGTSTGSTVFDFLDDKAIRFGTSSTQYFSIDFDSAGGKKLDIAPATPAADTAGNAIAVAAQNGGPYSASAAGNGGALTLNSGNGGNGVSSSNGGSGGGMTLTSGGGGPAASIYDGGAAGKLWLVGGTGGGLGGGSTGTSGPGGDLVLDAGNAGNGGPATGGDGGNINLTSGDGGNGSVANGDGGDITLDVGAAGAGPGTAGVTGNIFIGTGANAPTAITIGQAGVNTTVVGNLINNNGTFQFLGSNIDLDPTGTFDLAMDNGQAFSIDIDGAASNISLATDGAAQDLTIEVTGATDSSLILQSAGTGNDAVSINASAASVKIAAATDIELDAAGYVIGNSNMVAEAGGVALGDALYISSNGKLGKADADAAGLQFVVGFAAANASADAAVRLASIHGTVITVKTDLSGSTNGNVVYLAKSAGDVTTTAPSASGDTVFRVGYLVDKGTGAGDGKIIFMPQYITTIP